MWGSAMPPVNSPAISPLDAPSANIASCRSTESSSVPPPTADRFGEGDAEQPLLPGREVQLARDGAGVLPLLEVWSDLAAHELRAELPDLAQRFSGVPAALFVGGAKRGRRRTWRGGHMSSSWMCTTRERSHSPSPLACGSNRVDAATPWPSSPWTTTLTPPRFGST